MAINPNIALSYRAPEFASPVQMANQMMAFKAAQRENQLAEMQMAEAQRKREQTEQLNALYAQAYNPKTGQVDYGQLRAGAATAGQGSLIPGLIKTEQEDIEQRGKAGKAEADAFTAAMDASRSNLRLDMSPEEYLAWHENNHRDPIIGPYLARLGVTSDTTRPKIIEAINTGRLPDLIKESALGIDKMTEQHFVEQDLGRIKRLLRTPKRGGPAEVVPGSEAAVTPSPNAPRTTIVNQAPSKFSATMGERAATQLDTLFTQAESAQRMLTTSERLVPLLNSPEFISGTLGDARLAVAKALGLPGATETQAFFAAMGEQVAERIKAFGAGTGLSDKDREFAEKIAGGSVSLTQDAIKEIVRLNNASAKAVVGKYNERRDFYSKSDPDVLNYYPQLSAPAVGDAPVRVSSPDEARKLPLGTKFVTPDGRVMVR